MRQFGALEPEQESSPHFYLALLLVFSLVVGQRLLSYFCAPAPPQKPELQTNGLNKLTNHQFKLRQKVMTKDSLRQLQSSKEFAKMKLLRKGQPEMEWNWQKKESTLHFLKSFASGYLKSESGTLKPEAEQLTAGFFSPSKIKSLPEYIKAAHDEQ